MVSVTFAVGLAAVTAVLGFLLGVVYERDRFDPPGRGHG